MKSRTMPDEVFSWFKDAGFGRFTRRPASTSLRVAFVRKILQRYKEIEVYVLIYVFHVCILLGKQRVYMFSIVFVCIPVR